MKKGFLEIIKDKDTYINHLLTLIKIHECKYRLLEDALNNNKHKYCNKHSNEEPIRLNTLDNYKRTNYIKD